MRIPAETKRTAIVPVGLRGPARIVTGPRTVSVCVASLNMPIVPFYNSM